MQKLGNKVVELTDVLLKQSKTFFRTFNSSFSYVRLARFIFQDADYLEVSVKEVEEISAIFAMYELYIKELEYAGIQNPEYEKPRKLPKNKKIVPIEKSSQAALSEVKSSANRKA